MMEHPPQLPLASRRAEVGPSNSTEPAPAPAPAPATVTTTTLHPPPPFPPSLSPGSRVCPMATEPSASQWLSLRGRGRLQHQIVSSTSHPPPPLPLHDSGFPGMDRGAGDHQDTLANTLIHHEKSLSEIGGLERPGIVRRLDKDTSGLMVVATQTFG